MTILAVLIAALFAGATGGRVGRGSCVDSASWVGMDALGNEVTCADLEALADDGDRGEACDGVAARGCPMSCDPACRHAVAARFLADNKKKKKKKKSAEGKAKKKTGKTKGQKKGCKKKKCKGGPGASPTPAPGLEEGTAPAVSGAFTVSGMTLAEARGQEAVFVAAVAQVFGVDDDRVVVSFSENRRRRLADGLGSVSCIYTIEYPSPADAEAAAAAAVTTTGPSVFQDALETEETFAGTVTGVEAPEATNIPGAPQPTPPPATPAPSSAPSSPRPTPKPSLRSTPAPSPAPSPTSRPTPSPTTRPTPAPSTPAPTAGLTPVPSPKPEEPTRQPTTPTPSSAPSARPTLVPTSRPTPVPTPAPTPRPTSTPTPAPTPAPSLKPSPAPFPRPTPAPFPRPSFQTGFIDITINSDGTKLAAAEVPIGVYEGLDGSTGSLWIKNSGTAWERSPSTPNKQKERLAAIHSSPDGLLVASVWGGGIFTSTDWGATWPEASTVNDPGANQWLSIASSKSGNRLFAVSYCDGNDVTGCGIWRSTDSGGSWNVILSSKRYLAIASCQGGWALAATSITLSGDTRTGSVWTSGDGGGEWTERPGSVYDIDSAYWDQFVHKITIPNSNIHDIYGQKIASNKYGSKLALVVYLGHIWTSTNSGVDWVQRNVDAPDPAAVRPWWGISSDNTGAKLVACTTGVDGEIWTSADYGASWTKESAAATSTLDHADGAGTSWAAVTISWDGTKIAAVTDQGGIWVKA